MVNRCRAFILWEKGSLYPDKYWKGPFPDNETAYITDRTFRISKHQIRGLVIRIRLTRPHCTIISFQFSTGSSLQRYFPADCRTLHEASHAITLRGQLDGRAHAQGHHPVLRLCSRKAKGKFIHNCLNFNSIFDNNRVFHDFRAGTFFFITVTVCFDENPYS